MSFREFFELAQLAGLDQVDAAEGLLRLLISPKGKLQVSGVHRQWDHPTQAEERQWMDADKEWSELAYQLDEIPDGAMDIRQPIINRMKQLAEIRDAKYTRKERLPLNPQLKVLPKTIWHGLEVVDANLTSYWSDEPDDPEQVISVDWLAGTIETVRWAFPNIGGGLCQLDLIEEDYLALHVERNRANELIKRLSGASNTRGAPRGLRDPKEQKIARAIASAKRNGDMRDTGRIASDHMPPNLDLDEDRKLHRRLTREANRLLAENS